MGRASGLVRNVGMVAGSAPNWTDIGIFAATTAGVLVTLAAVLVALFGPALQKRWKRPVVWIFPEDSFINTSLNTPIVARLLLANEPGRDTARDVEVFIYATRAATSEEATGGQFRMPRGKEVVVDQANLNFDDPTGRGSGRSTASVPAGFSRPINFAALLDLDQHGLDARRAVGRVALYPPLLGRETFLWEDTTYEVQITVTGSNFDALAYRARLVISPLKRSPGEISARRLELAWRDFEPSKVQLLVP